MSQLEHTPELQAYIERVVAEAPPLSDSQRVLISSILGGVSAPHAAPTKRRGGKSKPTTRQSNAEQTLRRGGHLNPPLSLPYRALARSCPKCGDLITTPDHLLRRDAGELPRCRRCASSSAVATTRKRRDRDDEFRKKERASAAVTRKRLQAETVQAATRGRFDWTGPELEIVARPDLTAREVATMLGRTLYAVKHQRRAIRNDPRKARLADAVGEVAERGDPYTLSTVLREAVAEASGRDA